MEKGIGRGKGSARGRGIESERKLEGMYVYERESERE